MINGASFDSDEESRYEAARRRGDQSAMAAIEMAVDQRFLRQEAAREAAMKAAKSQPRPTPKPAPATAQIAPIPTSAAPSKPSIRKPESKAIPLYTAEGGPRKQADILVDIGRQHMLFHDAGGEGYACVKRDDHSEVHALDSRMYRELLAGEHYHLTSKGCNRNSLADGITTLCAEAKFKGEMRAVWQRVACDGNDTIIDLCTPTWQVVRVTKNGWRIEDGGAVMFRRAGKPRALPMPLNGDFGKLWKYLNVRPADRVLVAAFLLMVFNPRGPYPALILSGEQGTGKSSFAKALKRITDPSESALRSPPKEVRDLLVAALNAWLLCLDNISWLPPALSDSLCRLCTGGAISERTLYSNLEETLVELKRPVILNGIEELATRPDLAERGIHIELEPMTRRRTESQLWHEFDVDAPAIFGGLLDGISLAIRDVSSVKIAALPRMADFAMWAEAGLPALGFKRGKFMAAYAENLEQGLSLGLESSAVGRALQAFMQNRDSWTGAATDLLTNLAGYADESTQRTPAWPRSTRALHGHLARLGPALRAAGISVERARDAHSRLITLCSSPEQASQASHPSQAASQNDTCDANDASSADLHAKATDREEL